LGFFPFLFGTYLEIGAIWPPKGIDVLNPWGIPFLNNLILIKSGADVNFHHHAIKSRNKKKAENALEHNILLPKY
jgi:heme/copper-type cytochrome/quinol oxidase subunit 3